MTSGTRVLVGLAVGLSLVGCEININGLDRDQSHEAVETFSFEVPVPTQLRLRLENVNGRIEVTGDPLATTAFVTGEMVVGSDSRRDAQQFLQRVDVDVFDHADELLVQTDYPRDTDGRRVAVDYRVVIPADMDVHIDNVNGDVDVEHFDGFVDVDNTNGSVRIIDLYGDAVATVTNGSITGDVILRPSGFVDFAVVNGNVSLSVPDDVSAMFGADVTNGAINVVGLTVLDASATARSLHGQLGSGDGNIDLRTTNGTITLRGR